MRRRNSSAGAATNSNTPCSTLIECREAGDVEIKVEQGVFEFVAAPADEFLRRVQGQGVAGFDGVAGLARGLGVDADLSGEDGAFGLFTAVAQAAFHQGLVEANHAARVTARRAGVTCGWRWCRCGPGLRGSSGGK